MKTAVKVLVIIGVVIGWIWWIASTALNGFSAALASKLIPDAIVPAIGNSVFQFLAMAVCTVFGFIAAGKKVGKSATLVMSIFLFLVAIGLFPLGSYVASLLFATAGLIGFIFGCVKPKAEQPA